jgi:hypothetical protein
LTKHRLPVGISVPEKQYTLHFDDVRVPASGLVGTEHDGFRQVFDGLNPERITGAAVRVGIGRHAVTKGADYARTRTVWGPAIGSYQAISHPLAKAKIEVDVAAMMTAKARVALRPGPSCRGSIQCRQVCRRRSRGRRCRPRYPNPWGQWPFRRIRTGPAQWGLARLLQIAPVSREMILNYVAQHSLSLPRSYERRGALRGRHR